ncbi:WhiB family transcriptional regulator [Micromonospora chersina]|uniref:WhiB family transcriptional regulator n=1 Tax=Micromonospora chersina TaxID=47854 RepID=UPI0037B0A309
MRRFESVLGEWPSWIDTAPHSPACRSHPPDLFFPSATSGGKSVSGQVKKAKAICDACPLLNICREWAFRQPIQQLHGIWGGTTRSERRLLRKTGTTQITS